MSQEAPSEDKQKLLIQKINDYIGKWTKKYIFYTTYYKNDELYGHTYETTFSRPEKHKPIPVAIIKVYFYISSEDEQIKFRFENDSLFHIEGRTVRLSQMENWLECYLAKKQKTAQIMFLGTEFERTRIQEPRLQKIKDSFKKEEEIKEKHKVLAQELLQYPEELVDQKDFGDEKEQIQVLRSSLFNIFRTIDTDDLRVLSLPEIKLVFQQMQIKLDDEQWKELINMTNTQNNGLVKYEELLELGTELIYAIFLKNQAYKSIREREDEFLLQAIYILHNDEIHVVAKEIIKICQELDAEDEYLIIKVDKLQEIINNFDIFSQNEKDEFINFVKQNYIDDDFPYAECYNILLEIRLKNLKDGLMESSINKLEIYLRELCQPFDPENSGLCQSKDFVEALEKSSSIYLTKVQLFIIKSFIEENDQGNFNYLTGSRQIAAILKNFDTPYLLDKKALFQQKALVKEQDYMKGWSRFEIESDLKKLFKLYDNQNTGKIEIKELKKMVRDIKYKISDSELQYIIETRSKEGDCIYINEFIENFYDFLKIYRVNLALYDLNTI